MKLLTYDSIKNYEKIKQVWNGLIADKAEHSFFLSWEWIDTWLEALKSDGTNIPLVTIETNGQPVCAFFIGINSFSRHLFVNGRSASINAKNNEHYDEIYVEYNSFLVHPEYSIQYHEIFSHLITQFGLNEIIFPAISEKILRNIEKSTPQKFHVNELKNSTSYFINLNKIREKNGDYLSLLSKNRKRQIRSSINAYTNRAEIKIEEPKTIKEALLFLQELSILHQKKWESLDEPGAFSNQFLINFHKLLIKNNFMTGKIQLLKISCGNDTIGFLYNFIYQKKVYFYQSGFVYSSNNKFRPGLVSHYYSILLNLNKGNQIYDFLAGDEPYKKSLSTDSSDMYWITYQKSELQFYLEKLMKRTFYWLKKVSSSQQSNIK